MRGARLRRWQSSPERLVPLYQNTQRYVLQFRSLNSPRRTKFRVMATKAMTISHSDISDKFVCYLDKFNHSTGHEEPEGEYRYNFTLPLTPALDGGGWSTPSPGRFTSRERPATYRTGDWTCPKVGLDGCGKSRPPNGVWSPNRPAYEIKQRSQRALLSLFSFPFNPLTFTRVSLSL